MWRQTFIWHRGFSYPVCLVATDSTVQWRPNLSIRAPWVFAKVVCGSGTSILPPSDSEPAARLDRRQPGMKVDERSRAFRAVMARDGRVDVDMIVSFRLSRSQSVSHADAAPNNHFGRQSTVEREQAFVCHSRVMTKCGDIIGPILLDHSTVHCRRQPRWKARASFSQFRSVATGANRKKTARSLPLFCEGRFLADDFLWRDFDHGAHA